MSNSDTQLINHYGGCHCKAVRFVVKAPKSAEVEDCNCSICRMKGFLHLIVPASQFQLEGVENWQKHPAISCYEFGTKTAKHLFCKHCGIQAFYIPRSNPDGVDVNVHCLDDGTFEPIIVKFNGRDSWDEEAKKIVHKSK